ncbi:hypothetical protein, partial [Cribrihabitans pelagius]|uniref:hypothetical protein n=1 Tax=Cribrihabitans pelagius TaxID=1765746 RepID=UPI003B5C5435
SRTAATAESPIKKALTLFSGALILRPRTGVFPRNRIEADLGCTCECARRIWRFPAFRPIRGGRCDVPSGLRGQLPAAVRVSVPISAAMRILLRKD